MADAGAQIAQMYLSPFDQIVGIIGESGSGKRVLIKGMFPGLELTNDDEGVNVRPLPIMNLEDEGFFKPHTYHMDVRFELGFHQMHELAAAVIHAVNSGRRVIIEHFDLIYESLGRNADLLIGIGEELIVTRPSYFGPEPEQVSNIVFESVIYRKMAHTTEDLCEYCLQRQGVFRYTHGDVRHGFILSFGEHPKIDMQTLEADIRTLINQNIPISYADDNHILIGDKLHYCTAPRMHVDNTSEIPSFRLHPELIRDSITGAYMLIGIVGFGNDVELVDINSI